MRGHLRGALDGDSHLGWTAGIRLKVSMVILTFFYSQAAEFRPCYDAESKTKTHLPTDVSNNFK